MPFLSKYMVVPHDVNYWLYFSLQVPYCESVNESWITQRGFVIWIYVDMM